MLDSNQKEDLEQKLVDNLRKEVDSLSYISLEFVQTQVKNFSSANYKKCMTILNGISTQFDKIKKLINFKDKHNYEKERIQILEICVSKVKEVIENLNLKMKVI